MISFIFVALVSAFFLRRLGCSENAYIINIFLCIDLDKIQGFFFLTFFKGKQLFKNIFSSFFVRFGPLANYIARLLTPIYTLEFLLFMRVFFMVGCLRHFSFTLATQYFGLFL